MDCCICHNTPSTHIYTTSAARGWKGHVCLPCGTQCVREDTAKGYRAKKVTPIKG